MFVFWRICTPIKEEAYAPGRGVAAPPASSASHSYPSSSSNRNSSGGGPPGAPPHDDQSWGSRSKNPSGASSGEESVLNARFCGGPFGSKFTSSPYASTLSQYFEPTTYSTTSAPSAKSQSTTLGISTSGSASGTSGGET